MFHILWLNIKIIITIFPGILLLLLNTIPKIKQFKSIDKYSIALIFIVIINLLNNLNYQIQFLCVIVSVLCLFVIEYIFIEWRRIDYRKFVFVLSKIKKPMYIMCLYPLCEELIYRYFFYQFISEFKYKNILFCVLSISCFVFVHFYNQKYKSLFKIPFAIVECILFIYFKNVYLCILVHAFFNVAVYSFNISKYMTITRS